MFYAAGPFGYVRPNSAVGVDNALMREVASRARLRVSTGAERSQLQAELVQAGLDDTEAFLDIVDDALQSQSSFSSDPHALRKVLAVGDSVWTVAENGRALRRRLNESATAGFNLAVSAADLASQQLREAWAAAYERAPDAHPTPGISNKTVEDTLLTCTSHR